MYPDCWGYESGRGGLEAGGEVGGTNQDGPSELGALGAAEACGMRGVGVKCIVFGQNPDCKGGVPCRH